MVAESGSASHKSIMNDDLSLERVVATIHRAGFALCDHARMRAWLGAGCGRWHDFAASWNDLPEDRHMADGRRYRRRRFAVLDLEGTSLRRAPHQPHFQARAYNRLNGGIARWFESVSDGIASHPIICRLVCSAGEVFDTLFADRPPSPWHVEMHQFRIEASRGQSGLPTPEGIHRDGVDGVVVMLIDRQNVASGITELFDPQKRRLGAFTLAQPGDAVFLDDARIFHGVTPITPLNPDLPAIRDVLVVTFQRSDGGAGVRTARE